jgi:hypothetical protein
MTSTIALSASSSSSSCQGIGGKARKGSQLNSDTDERIPVNDKIVLCLNHILSVRYDML